MTRRPRRTASREKVRAAEQSKPRPDAVASYGRGEAALFALTLFLSAALLFTVQPMFAKMVLPLLGGAPAVWNACLVFYQAALLAGYLYAHLSLEWLGPRRQAVLHLVLLGLACLALPVRVAQGWLPPATTFPAPWLWMLLAVSLGLPFLAVSATAPMLQAWFAQTRKPAGRDPYFLYAASNLGSLLALLAYPLVFEAKLTLAHQSGSWAIGYGLLMVLIAACAARLWRAPLETAVGNPLPQGETAGLARPTVRRRLHWLALSLVPSSLLLGVTTHISVEVTPRPLVWIIPLALYLLTFVLVFAPRTILPLGWMVRAQPLLIVIAAATLLCSATGLREVLLLGSLHLAAFFVTAMVCHGQLAADRPAASQLTEFYLWMSLGGVLGGLFSALVAPVVFSSVLEYPLMLAAACMLRPRVETAGGKVALPITALLLCLVVAWGLRTDGFLTGHLFTDSPLMRIGMVGLAIFATFLLRRRPGIFGAAVAALAAISLWSVDTRTRLLDAQRSFFGILRVEEDPVWNTHQLMHGTTSHGQQSLFQGERREPRGYYHREGPLGGIFDTLKPCRPLAEVGVLGLGVGTIAAYAEPGERFTFYEIDPAVERIARNSDYFTYLADCRGAVEVVLGDARLSLEHGPSRQFDLLIVDVFSSDSVPVHLITREALRTYVGRLNLRGLLAIHISSRYVGLEPILGKLAEDAGLTARLWRDGTAARAAGKFPSVWVVMARSSEDLGPLAADARWQPLLCDAGPVWTDDFSNVAGVLQWKTSGVQLLSWKWAKSDQAEEHALRAMALLDQGQTDAAIEHLQKSLEIEPQSAPHHFSLGVALASQGRLDEAVDHLQAAVSLDPNHAAAHSNLGAALERQGEKDEAIEHFRRAVEIDPKYVDGLRNLGKALLDRRQYSEAAGYFRRAIAVQPESAEIHFDLGRALKQQAKIKDALGELRQALPLAEAEKNAALVAKIKAEIRRCEAWPWDDEEKK